MKTNASDQPATCKGLRVQRLVRLFFVWGGVAIPALALYILVFWLTPMNHGGLRAVALTHFVITCGLWFAWSVARLLHRA